MTNEVREPGRADERILVTPGGPSGRLAEDRAAPRWVAGTRALITAVLFAGLGFVAGARSAPGHLAAAPDAPLRAAEVEGECEAALPPGHPPIGSTQVLPPGHPPVPGFRRLPAGHPPIRSMPPPTMPFEQPSIVTI